MRAQNQKAILWDLERLALFSNANTQSEREQFRKNQDGFFPSQFWNWQIRPFEAGEFVISDPVPKPEPMPFCLGFQNALREAWQTGFPLDACVRLISCAAVADRLTGKSDVQPDLLSYSVWPYQRAVMQLCVEPWRARFCGQCGKQFVAEKPARRFCSIACSSNARKQAKRLWWSEKGEEWRADREPKRAKQIAKGKRSRRTKR